VGYTLDYTHQKLTIMNKIQTPQPTVTNNGTIFPALMYQERQSIYKERRRQAKTAFNLAFVLTSISAIAGFAGIMLLFAGNISAGTVTAAGGGIYGTVTASWLKLAKDANDRLDEAARALEAET
jgi:hypothetical protein